MSKEKNTAMGLLKIKDLSIICIIGILPHERKKTQQLLVSLEMEVDFHAVRHSETRVEGGVDYVSVAQFVTRHLEEGRFYLLEELMLSLGERLISRFRQIKHLRLKVSKPSAIANALSTEAEMNFVSD